MNDDKSSVQFEIRCCICGAVLGYQSVPGDGYLCDKDACARTHRIRQPPTLAQIAAAERSKGSG